MASQNGRFIALKANTSTAPRVTISPWAKLVSPVVPKIRDRPTEASASRRPKLRPATSLLSRFWPKSCCWTTMPLPKAKMTERFEVWLNVTVRGFACPSASLMPSGSVDSSSSTLVGALRGNRRCARIRWHPRLLSPVKSPLLAVILTPSRGARVSSRRKPLMLFWNWFDGGGVGEGVVACDAGAATSRIATTAEAMAPMAFSNPAGRRRGRPLGVRLKLKTSTWGWSGLRRCNRCERRR